MVNMCSYSNDVSSSQKNRLISHVSFFVYITEAALETGRGGQLVIIKKPYNKQNYAYFLVNIIGTSNYTHVYNIRKTLV